MEVGARGLGVTGKLAVGTGGWVENGGGLERKKKWP